MVALSIIGIILAAVVYDIVASHVLAEWSARRRRRLRAISGEENPTPLDEHISFEDAPGVFHHRGHTWLHWRRQGEALIGADDLFLRVVGRIDEIRLPAPGDRLRLGEKAVMIRQGDRVLYLPAPAAGTVSRTNSRLLAETQLLKQDPYEEGWLYTIVPSDVDTALTHLRIGRRASDWLRRESTRMYEFFNELLRKGTLKVPGGAVSMEGLLEKADDMTWILFKDRFIYQQEWRS